MSKKPTHRVAGVDATRKPASSEAMAEGASGRRIAGRYSVEGTLGAGGMGVVLRGRDDKLRRDVAIKLLPTDAVGSERARARLVREARAAASLEHPGIVRIYDVGTTEEGEAFIVMELVRGRSLRALLAEGGLSLAERVRLIGEIAGALSYAHAAGLVHRDVKPDNVFVRDDGRAVVLDFGLARTAEDDTSEDGVTVTNVTADGVIAGTPAYMAPEQFAGEPLDGRADQFALGVVAYQALTGSLPWKSTNGAQMLAEILSKNPAPPSSVAPALPAALDTPVLRALAKQPGDRYADVESFAKALAAAVATKVPAAPAAAQAGDATPTDSVPGPIDATVTQAPASPVRRRSRRALAIVAVAAAAVLAVDHYGWVRQAVTAPAPAATGSAAARVASVHPGTVLACPAFEVRDASDSPGWIGAAAADAFCRKAVLRIGGSYERLRVPAELLGLPARPSSTLPHDPYDAAGARAQALARARGEDGAVIADGEVELVREGFDVVVRLERSGGEVGRGQGRGRDVAGAVERALGDLVGVGALPVATPLDGEVADLFPVTAADLRGDLLDLNVFGRNPEAPCSRLEGRSGELGVARHVIEHNCRYALARIPGPAPAVDLDATSPMRLAHSAVARIQVGIRPDEATLATLDDELAREPSAQRRAALATSLAALRSDSDPARARELALAAVLANPRFEGAWGALVAASYDRSGMTDVQRAASAWVPSDWNGYNTLARFGAPGAAERVRYQRLGYLLFGLQPAGGVTLADVLLDAGDVEAARALAAEVQLSEAPPAIKLAAAELIRARVEAAEGQFHAAFERVLRFMATWPEYGWGQTGDMMLTLVGREVGFILGREREYADAFVSRYLLSEPAAVVPFDLTVFMPVAINCALASPELAVRCVAAVRRELASPRHLYHIDVNALLEGAVAHAEGRYHEAAAAFRPLAAAAPSLLTARAAVVISNALDRAGDHDLAERIDAPLRDRSVLYAGAGPADVRSAFRAAATRRHADARAHAGKVIAAWGTQRHPPAHVRRMRELLARLPP